MFPAAGSSLRLYAGGVLRGLATIVLAALFAAALLRFSPGWSADAEDLDPRLSNSTLNELREERARERGLLRFFADFARQVTTGNLGDSELFGRPVRDLIGERAGTTAAAVSAGLAGGWLSAVLIGLATCRKTASIATASAACVSATFLSCPSALLGIVSLALGLPPGLAIGAIIFSRVFPHVHERLRRELEMPHILMARARGISWVRLMANHVAPGVVPALAALAGASVPVAIGAAIPIESLTDSPGLGQLAWRAALGRDMPLLVSLTLLLTLVSVSSGLAARLATLSTARGRV